MLFITRFVMKWLALVLVALRGRNPSGPDFYFLHGCMLVTSLPKPKLAQRQRQRERKRLRCTEADNHLMPRFDHKCI